MLISMLCLVISLLMLNSSYTILPRNKLGADLQPFYPSSSDITMSSCHNVKIGVKNKKRPIILFNSRYFGERDVFRESQEKNESCTKCFITSDRCFYQYSDIVIFHWPDLELNEIPTLKMTGQRWILYTMESPDTLISRGVHLKKLHSIIDRIDDFMSYRSDSSIYTPYGRIIPRNNYNASVDKTQQNHDEDNTFSHNMWIIRNKTQVAAWFVSNCHTASRREDYVSELKKHMDIDVYGSCGQHICPRIKKGIDCYQMVGQKYYFYLSFENSLCKDYVTEKLFNILSFNVVPVVFGSGNYDKILPHGSYINALDFKEPKDLAEYLIQLTSDSERYLKYFEWKQHFDILDSRVSLYSIFCDTLCHLRNLNISSYMHTPSHTESNSDQNTGSWSSNVLNVHKTRMKFDKRNFRSWWFRDSNCHSWRKSLFSSITSIFD